jgi:ribose/xylose/arabinose/galactoside ABC-type transport system permease subunit
MSLPRDPVALRVIVLLALWAASLVVMGLLSPFFWQQSTLPYLLRYVPVLGLLGMGQALIMLSGGPGIDLSAGSMVSLVGLAVGALAAVGVPIGLACLVGLLCGAALGAFNGLLVAVLAIPSLMATLATLFAYSGLALALTGGLPITGLPANFAWLGQGALGGFPFSFLLILLPAAIILHVMLTMTVVGSHIVACGNDENAAHLLGVRVRALRFGLYVLNGLLAALGAIILLSWFLAARPDAGQGFELLAITIAVLGGTHIFGGQGGIPGTVLAVLIVTTLQIGLQLANISAAWQLGVIGALLLAGVGFNMWLEGRRAGI